MSASLFIGSAVRPAAAMVDTASRGASHGGGVVRMTAGAGSGVRYAPGEGKDGQHDGYEGLDVPLLDRHAVENMTPRLLSPAPLVLDVT